MGILITNKSVDKKIGAKAICASFCADFLYTFIGINYPLKNTFIR